MNIAVYYRVSTDKQDFAMQKYVVEEWLAKFPAKKVQVFQDYAQSGAKRDRPQYELLLKLADARKIDAIVVYKLDRLSRSASDAIELFIRLERLKVDLVCITQPILSTVDNPFRRTIFAAFAEIAEIERSILIERIRSGIKAARARGVIFGAPIKRTPELTAKIKALREKKKTYREISHLLDISLGTINKALN